MTSRASCLENRGVYQPPPQDRSTPMSEKPISPLRRRMIEDMTVRNFVEKTHNDYTFVPLGHISEDFYNTVFDTNVKVVIFTVQKALSLLKDGGTIVLNASTTASQGMPNFSVYAASKAAVRNLARGWANDLKDRKIRVNAVSPGVVVTPAYYKSGLTEEQVKGFAAQMGTKIPLGRTGEEDEIAKAVVFLASDDSSFVNAVELLVDGGMVGVG